LADDLFEHRQNLSFVSDIGAGFHGYSAIGDNIVHHCLSDLGLDDIVDGDGCSRRSQMTGNRFTDSGIGAGNKGLLACQWFDGVQRDDFGLGGHDPIRFATKPGIPAKESKNRRPSEARVLGEVSPLRPRSTVDVEIVALIPASFKSPVAGNGFVPWAKKFKKKTGNLKLDSLGLTLYNYDGVQPT